MINFINSRYFLQIVCGAYIFLFFGASNALAQDECYRARDFTDNQQVKSIILTELKTVGVCVKLLPLSHSKATEMLKAGSLDLDLARVGEYQQITGADIVKVGQAWIKNQGIMICQQGVNCTREALPKYSVAKLRSAVWSKEFLSENQQIFYVANYDIMKKMFERKRVDALLLSNSFAMGYPFKIDIPYQATVLREAELYVWALSKRQMLIAKVGQAMPEIIKKIKAIQS